MVVFFWDNEYKDLMEVAAHNRKPLPRIPTHARTKTSHEMNSVNTLNEVTRNSTRTSRLPSTILNRSATRSLVSPPNPKANRTKTALLSRPGNLSSLYSHLNFSGDLRSESRSPIVPIRSSLTFSIPAHLDRHKFPLQPQHRLPPFSLLRSRRKLWKRYWLVVNLPTIPEANETVHVIESAHRLCSRSERLVPRKPPSLELPSMQPLSTNPRIIETSPPELDDDTGSESSSSDEDLDAYEFDLSCCTDNIPDRLVGKRKDSQPAHLNSVRVANHLDTDISSIYETITRRTLAGVSL